jgi:diguanylate cyclase (GGDEF)-like protein/PAS domain S-box-containing protein
MSGFLRTSGLDSTLDRPEEFLSRILETNVSAITVVDAEGRIVFANPAAERVHGVRRDGITDRTFDDPDWWITDLEGEPLPEEQLPFRRVMDSGQPVIGAQHAIHWPSGERRYLAINGAPLWDGDPRAGGRIEGVVFSIEDITERLAYQDRLRRMAVVFQSTREGVMVTDPRGFIEDVNPAFSQITGYDPSEVVGRNPSFLQSGRHDAAFYREMWTAIAETGSWQGEIWNRRKDGEIYPEWLTINRVCNGDGKVAHYVAVFSDITQVKESEAELEHLAHHDPLTDLPNRLLLRARLERAMGRADRDGTLVAVLFLDLDRFKDINSSLDHAMGDRVLTEVAGRLANAVGAGHTVARMGGDEFPVLVEGVTDPHEVQPVIQRISAALAEPVTVGGESLQLTFSGGVSFYPRDGESVEKLLRNADAAMYRAKEAGGNTSRFYSRDMTERVHERVTLERALQRAIERDELELHYQAQWGLEGPTLDGMEALVRWRHPEEGLISPARFIPLAEESGLILPLGEWVLNAACCQARAWLDRGVAFGRVAVNVSVPQLQQGDLVASVQRALRVSGLPGERLELEVTESSLLAGGEDTVRTLDALRALGLTLAVDDFGTGYSSLTYLKRLPIDRLKVDKGFVQDIPVDADDMAITRAVIHMGRALGLSVLAEGVETEEQWQFLKAEGAHAGQGFLWHKPTPDPDFSRF